MSLKITLVLFFFWTVLLSSSICLAKEQESPDSRADRLFAIVDRLEKEAPWNLDDIAKIERIIGRTLKERGYAGYDSIERPNDILLRNVELSTDPREHRVTGIWLELPKQGLGITLDHVRKRYGMWSYMHGKTNYDNDTFKRFGYRTLLGYAYKRNNGGYLSFMFDADMTKQLRILKVIGP